MLQSSRISFSRRDAVQGQWEGKGIRRDEAHWSGSEPRSLFCFIFRWIGMANAIGWLVGSFMTCSKGLCFEKLVWSFIFLVRWHPVCGGLTVCGGLIYFGMANAIGWRVGSFFPLSPKKALDPPHRGAWVHLFILGAATRWCRRQTCGPKGLGV